MGSINNLPGLGNVLKQLRIDKGKNKGKRITQRAMADILGVNVKAYAKWEEGKSLPDVYLLHLFGQDVGVTLDDIVKQSIIEK